MAAVVPPPETALSSAADGSDDEDGDQCRICRFPAEADRPLRRPCACSGSIRFVHDDCLLRWLATSRQSRCEVCSREITISPLYAPNAPARLPLSEFMLGLANKVMGWVIVLLSLVVAVLVWEFIMPVTTLWTWRLALSRSFAQVRHLLSLRLSATSFADGLYRFRFMPSVDTIFACVSIRRAFVRDLGHFRQLNGLARIGADAVAPFALWVARLETHLQNRFGGLDSLQVLALHTVEASLMILRPGVSIPFVHLAEEHNVKLSMREPFYIISFKKLPRLFAGIINVGMVFLVPVQIAGGLAPKLFPLDITYFDPPTKGTSFWQAPRTYAELLSGIVFLSFLICNTLKYLQPHKLVEKILRNWFATTGQALDLLDLLIVQPDGACRHEVSNSVAPNDQYGSTYEAMANRRSVAVRMTLLVVLAWLTVVIFNTVVLIFPISVGRALLLAIPQLPVAGGFKFNDLFAFAVGFCTISTIIAASRESFVNMTSGRTCLLASVICKWGITALKSSPLLFIWIVIIPILIGLLVDFLLISPFKFLVDFLVMSPFIVPADDIPVLDLFSIWFLGLLLLKFWTNLAHWTRDAPFLAHFIDGRWDWKLSRAKDDGFAGLRAKWVFQDILMPVTMKLVIVLGVPYVLAKGLFPRFGYSAAVNSAVYHFAWLGSLALCGLCYLAKVFWGALVKLHDSIRDERYIIGQRLQDYTDNS
ncbi:probable E3 ubiquitin ligase SUD1 isoform X4 [Triticum dicoccoides]|uniref:probable E3 ubiquitin ligase SUD1 isoform X4 n=1 Tax=Triticum dicoccoides TaxID=85692 RepID=UPI001890EB78|nr:probable E3 ubiquitin ligase SUD1 isoform X4 [Triticum dicoccoides]